MAQQIRYGIGFDVKKDGLQQIKKSLKQLQNLTSKDLLNLNKNLNSTEASRALTNIIDDAKRVENALKEAFNAKLNTVNIESFNKVLKDSGSSIQQVYTNFSKAGTAGQSTFRSLASQVLNTNIQLKESHTILDKIGTTLANTIKWNIASSAVNTLTRSVQQAWGYVKSLDTSLNDIRIVTGKSSEEMGNFAKQANEAAESLGRTTTDYTKAALIYAQQGLDDEEIAKRSQITLKTANVTGQSTDAVSEELTAVWNGYKVNAEQAEVYVDRLAAVAATTASDLEELSTGMSKVASAANAMGVSEEQLAAQLSTIISATRQAPESVGTALRTVYARISDIKAGIDEDGVDLGNYSGKMAELGFNVLDVNGNLRDMGTVMEEIGNQWGNLTREQQISLAQTMAGQRQYSNLIALFDNFQQYNKALNTAQNAAGTLQQQQDIYMESTAAHLEQLTASIENIYDSLINTDSINTLIDGISNATELIGNFVDGIGGGGNLLKSLGAIGLTVFSDQIAKGINTTITNIQIAKDNMQQFEQTLQATEKWQGIPGLDETTQKLLASRQQILENAQLMTPEQFTTIQDKLGEVTQATNKSLNLQSQKENLDGAIQAVIKGQERIKNGWKDVNAILEDSNAQNAVLQRLKEQQEEFLELSKILEDYKADLNEINNIQKDDNGAYSAKLDQMKVKLDSYLSSLEKLVSEGKMSQHEQAVERLREEYSNLGEAKNPLEAIGTLMAKIAGLSGQAAEGARNISQKLKNDFQGTYGAMEEQVNKAKTDAQKKSAEFEVILERMVRASTISNFISLAGGIAQVGSAIQQVQHLGSIWNNEDLTTGQKLLQIITNLAMSLPMFYSGFQKVSAAVQVLKIKLQEQSVEAIKNAAANELDAKSMKDLGQSANGASEGVSKLGENGLTFGQVTDGIKGKVSQLWNLIKAHPFLTVVAAVVALTTAIGAWAKAQDKANEKLIENNQKQIEDLNKKQEQIEKNKQLYSSIDDLNNQYKKGEISRADLRSGIQSLTAEYEEEGKHIDDLIAKYGSLTKAIQQAKIQAAEQGVQSAKTEKKNTEENILTTAKGKTFGDGRNVIGNTFSISMGEDGSTEIRKAFQDAGAIWTPNGYSFKTDFETDNIVQQYNKLAELRDTIQNNQNIKDSDRQNSGMYQKLNDYLKEMQEPVKAYQQVEEQLLKYQTDLVGLTQQQNGNLDFSLQKIKNGNDYYEQRKKLIEEILKLEDFKGDRKDATDLADAFLQKNNQDTFSQYDERAQFIDRLNQRWNGRNGNGRVDNQLGKTFENTINGLNETQFTSLMDMIEVDPEAINSWEQLKALIDYIKEQNLSNLTEVSQNPPDLYREQLQSAAQNYNKYQPVQEAVREGKTISGEQLEALDPSIQSFFTMMADGTYKMQGDAQQFYEKINGLKLDGFTSTLDSINQKINSLEKAKNQENFDYNELNKTAVTVNRRGENAGEESVDYDLANKQLEYLDAVSAGNEQLQKRVQIWQVLAEKEELQPEHLRKIAEEIALAGNQSEDFGKKQDQLKEKAKQLEHQIHDAMVPTDSDIDQEVLQKFSEHIQNIAESSDELDDNLKDNSRAAEDVAEQILRFDDAIQDVTNNYQDWSDALENGSEQDKVEAMEDLSDAYGDLLDIDGSSLSEDFLKSAENLDLMKQAAEGSEEAYNELQQKAQQDIAIHAGFDSSAFDAGFDSLMSKYYQGQSLEDMEIGASLNDEGFLQELSNMVNAAGMTAQQAEDYLSSMGIDAEVIQNTSDAEQQQEAIAWRETLTPHQQSVTDNILSAQGQGPPALVPVTQTVTSWAQDVVADVVPGTAKKQNKSFGLKVVSANKSSGGGFKYKQSSHGGGSKGSGSKGGSGKGKKGGGGKKGGKGSSKKNEPDKSQKDLQKKLKDERDIYHDINIQIGKINKNLDRTQKKQDRLYGKQLLQNLNKQTKILEQHKKKLEEKNKLQQQDLKNQQAALSNLGVTFNKYGDIANYMDSLGKKQNEINSLIDKQNALIQKYNKETNKDKKKKIGDSIEKVDKTKSTKEEEYKDLQDKIKDYDKLREQMEDIKDQIEEQTQKQIEIQITKFRMKVEIRLEMGQAQRDWNKFRRDVLQHTNILKDSNFSSILKDAQLNQTDAQSYFKVGNSPGSFETLTKQLLQTREQIESINQTGTSTIYGDNKKQAMQDLKSDLDELMSQMEDYESLIDEIDQAYLDTIDDVEEFFDKQIEDYEYVNDLINHDMDLLTLLYGEKNYNAMDKYYTKLQSNNLKQIDSLKRQRDFWGQQWKEAAAAGDTKAAEKFKENYKKVIADLNSVVEDAAQTIQDKYINAIDNIFDRLDKKMTNGKGTDYLSMEWDLMQKNADEYLDTINSAFAIQQTERKYQKAINDTKNIKNQKELKKVMNEQLSILKNKQKLTQYDVDRAQKLLQVEQARIALEDARSAKTSMQLKRDSQGNYSYEYVADNDAIADAESEYANTVNDLYNFDLDRYKSNLQDMLSAWEEFQEKYKEIQLDVSLTDEERIQRLKLLEEEYGEYINDKTAENLVVRKNLKESAFQDMQQLYADDVAEFQNMSDSEKDILMNQLVPEWESGIQRMTDKFSAQGGFIPSCEEAFKNIHTATVDYEKELDELAKTADTDFSSLRNGIDDTADSFSNLIDKNDELIDQMQTELDEIKDLKTAAHDLSLEYKNVYDQAKQATKAIYDFMQAERERAAEEAKREAAANGQGAAGGGTQARFTGDSFAGILKAQGDQKLNKLIKSGKIVARQTVDQQISAGGLGGSSHNLIQGLAGNILLTNEWGNGEDRKQKMIEKFGDQLGKELYNRTGLYLQEIASNEEKKKNFIAWVLREPDWFRIFDYAQFQSNQAMYTQNVNSFVRQGNKGYVYDTGGYTGNWNSSEGRPAILHEKQLVLNQEDTKNILSSVSIMRSIMTSLTGSLTSRLDNLKTNSLPFSFEQKGDTIEQQVSIQASFPNVNSKREIQEALNDLVNLAAQRAMR